MTLSDYIPYVVLLNYNVSKTIINHPPNHHTYRCQNHPKSIPKGRFMALFHNVLPTLLLLGFPAEFPFIKVWKEPDSVASEKLPDPTETNYMRFRPLREENDIFAHTHTCIHTYIKVHICLVSGINRHYTQYNNVEHYAIVHPRPNLLGPNSILSSTLSNSLFVLAPHCWDHCDHFPNANL